MLSYKDFLNTLVKPDSSSRLPPTSLENIDPEGIWSKYQQKFHKPLLNPVKDYS